MVRSSNGRVRTARRWLCPALLLVVQVSVGQDTGPERTYFDNLTLDPDGHICYTESLDGSDMNRIEYREEGRGIISLYKTVNGLAKIVETKDFNDDRKPDIITVEWIRDGTDITRTTLYRGRQYAEHLKVHLQHALHTATRHLIRDREVERERASEIRGRIEELNNRVIGEDEVGIFTSTGGFRSADHKNIRYAFSAADNLNSVLSAIVAGDYRLLSQKTELTKEYKLDIDILLSLDPASRKL